MKEKYRKFKELKRNPRYNALFKLIFWFLFFGIIYLIIISGISPSKYAKVTDNGIVNKTINPIENYGNMQNYEYTYTFNYNDGTDKTVVVNGTYFKEKYYFTIGENTYYFSDEIYLVLKDSKELLLAPKIDLPIGLTEIDKMVVSNWLSSSSKESEITYNDNSKIVEYIYTVENSYKIYLEVSIKNYYIETINMNLVDFLSTKDLQFKKFDVKIEYKNINNISSYKRNYDEYEVIHESV